MADAHILFYRGVKTAIAKLSENETMFVDRVKQERDNYMSMLIEGYEFTILKENPSAGFSASPSSALYDFVLEFLTAMNPHANDNEQGLRGRIQKVLCAYAELPPF